MGVVYCGEADQGRITMIGFFVGVIAGTLFGLCAGFVLAVDYIRERKKHDKANRRLGDHDR